MGPCLFFCLWDPRKCEARKVMRLPREQRDQWRISFSAASFPVFCKTFTDKVTISESAHFLFSLSRSDSAAGHRTGHQHWFVEGPAIVTSMAVWLCLPLSCCRGSFLSHLRNAGRRVWRARGQLACHRFLECFLLCFDVPPFPVHVCPARRAQGHLRCPPHLLPLRDVRPALHLPSVDYRDECECSRGLNRPKLLRGSCWRGLCVLLQFSSSIKDSLENEVIHYSYKSSFFDIFVSSPVRVCLLHFNVE